MDDGSESERGAGGLLTLSSAIASSSSSPARTAVARQQDPEVVEDALEAVDTTDAVELARAETAEDRTRRAVAAEAAARTQVAAVREDLAALALQRAGDVELRSQERLKASEAVAKQKTETQKWRERYEATEHSRLSQKGQLEELRRLQKQCARLEGRAEALEERVKIESTRRRKAEAACDAQCQSTPSKPVKYAPMSIRHGTGLPALERPRAPFDMQSCPIWR